jgi:hypothetical protein
MPISNYNTGFPNGVTIRNVPILDVQNGDGKVFWVDYNKGSNENKGTFTFPFKTLLYALTQVTLSEGDKIFLASGHDETITDASTYNINSAGIQIIGMGNEESRPIIRFTTTVNAKLTILADNVSVSNVLFLNGIASLVNMVSVTGYGTTLEGCKFVADTHAVVNFVDVGESNLKLIDCELDSSTGSPDSAILYSVAASDTQYLNCRVLGTYVHGCFYIPSTIPGSGVKNLFVDGGSYTNDSSAATSYFLKSSEPTCTGIIGTNVEIRVNNPEKLPIYNVLDSHIGKGKAGDVISFSVDVPVSKVTSSSAYLLQVTSGSFLLENCVINTTTALGGATNVDLDCITSLAGAVDYLEEAVTNLGTRVSVSLENATLASFKPTFTQGSELRVNKTGAALTGGDFLVTYSLRLLEDGSTIVKNPSY